MINFKLDPCNPASEPIYIPMRELVISPPGFWRWWRERVALCKMAKEADDD
jgi:hypothetical protein